MGKMKKKSEKNKKFNLLRSILNAQVFWGHNLDVGVEFLNVNLYCILLPAGC
jgi:hypothetical protein